MGQAKRRGTRDQRVKWAQQASLFVINQFKDKPRELSRRLAESGDARRLAERMINDTAEHMKGS